MLYWKDQKEKGEPGSDFALTIDAGVEMLRITNDEFVVSSFWGPEGKDSINPEDIVQGALGNCWILSAVSALAEDQTRVDNLVVNEDISAHGIYGVNMYVLGVPMTVYVDDYLPTNSGKPLFAGFGKDESVWGAIVEKAFAKSYGNYQHMVGGWMATGVSRLNGSPFELKNHAGENPDFTTDDEVWAYLTEHDSKSNIITAATTCPPGVAAEGCHTP